MNNAKGMLLRTQATCGRKQSVASHHSRNRGLPIRFSLVSLLRHVSGNKRKLYDTQHLINTTYGVHYEWRVWAAAGRDSLLTEQQFNSTSSFNFFQFEKNRKISQLLRPPIPLISFALGHCCSFTGPPTQP